MLKGDVKLQLTNFSFSNRAASEWNVVLEEIVAGNSLSAFKRKLDCHLRCIRGYNYVIFVLFSHE